MCVSHMMMQMHDSIHIYVALNRIKKNQRKSKKSLNWVPVRNVINRPGFIGGEERIWFGGNLSPLIYFSGPINNQMALP